MTQQYQQLLKLLNRFEFKINEFSAFRIFNNDYSKIIENSQLCLLEKHLEIEIIDLSKMFDVSRKSAIILSALFFNSYIDAEGFVSKAISEQDLMLLSCLDTQIIYELQEAILELENKNILKVNILDVFGNKSYEWTTTFINTIKLLNDEYQSTKKHRCDL